MVYCSVDIETSGLDSERNCVLSIGIIIEDTSKKLSFSEIPKLNILVLQREITGSPRAINMNKDIIGLIGDYLEGTDATQELIEKTSGYEVLDSDDVSKRIFDFLFLNGFAYELNLAQANRSIKGQMLPIIGTKTRPVVINVAGKNFGTFDKLFLEKLLWWKKLINIRSRILDPAILMCDWKNDTSLPNLTECKNRANVEGIVTHNALEDAWDVIQILRKSY